MRDRRGESERSCCLSSLPQFSLYRTVCVYVCLPSKFNRRRVHLQDAHREPFVQDTPLLLEIIHEIFKGHEPADLARLGDPHKDPVAAMDLKIRQETKARGDYAAHDATAAKRPDALLVQLMEKESQTKTTMPNRHARFGGVYRRQYDVGTSTV